MAIPLGQEGVPLPPKVREIVTKARISWLRNSDVLDLLVHYESYRLKLASEAPNAPPGGSLFLFDRRTVRFFRKDGHEWRKKADGRTVRETHEKLKWDLKFVQWDLKIVTLHESLPSQASKRMLMHDNKDILNCYYAHSEEKDGLQRRCYWMLDKHKDIVLVHYLDPHASSRAADSSTLNSQRFSGNQGAQRDQGRVEKSAASQGPVACGLQSQMSGSYVVTTGEPLTEARSENDESALSMPWNLPLEALLYEDPEPLERRNSSSKATQIPVVLKKGTREHSIGPLHAAPSFSAGTVQTGSTVSSCNDLQALGAAAHQADAWEAAPGRSSTMRHISQVSQRPETSDSSFRNTSSQSVSEHSKRMRDAPGPSDSCLVEMSSLQLKPAISLTRVNSDTLRVAPSVSGATSGKTPPLTEDHPMHVSSSSPQYIPPSALVSPFYLAAFSGQPVSRPRVREETWSCGMETMMARSAPVNATLPPASDSRQWKKARPDSSISDQSCSISAPENPRGPACDFRAVPRRQFPVAYCHSILDDCGRECEFVMPGASNVQCSQQRPQTHHFANLHAFAGCFRPDYEYACRAPIDLPPIGQVKPTVPSAYTGLQKSTYQGQPAWMLEPPIPNLDAFPVFPQDVHSDVDWTYELPLL